MNYKWCVISELQYLLVAFDIELMRLDQKKHVGLIRHFSGLAFDIKFIRRALSLGDGPI